MQSQDFHTGYYHRFDQIHLFYFNLILQAKYLNLLMANIFIIQGPID